LKCCNEWEANEATQNPNKAKVTSSLFRPLSETFSCSSAAMAMHKVLPLQSFIYPILLTYIHICVYACILWLCLIKRAGSAENHWRYFTLSPESMLHIRIKSTSCCPLSSAPWIMAKLCYLQNMKWPPILMRLTGTH